MVARSPPKRNQMLAVLNRALIRETLNKVDQCMVRLQELQYTVAGGKKVVSGVSLSPRSTRGYLRTSLRCKQESVRIKHDAPRRSPPGKFPKPENSGEEWRQMSLPAMLVGETVGEILKASQFAREIVSAVSRKTATKEPKTPQSQRSKQKVDPENTQLNARRRKEKQIKPLSDTPPPQRARSRINFKVSPPKRTREFDKENNNKCLPNRACASNSTNKTVLVPKPLFLSTHSSRQQQFCKTKSHVISRNIGTQQKSLIKSPPSASSKVQVKVNNPSIMFISSSSTRPTNTSLSLSKKSSPTKRWVRTFSPRVATRLLASPIKSKKTVQKCDVNLRKCSPKRSVASKLCRSFSPSRLATRFASPLKSMKRAQQSHGLVSGLKQPQQSDMLLSFF